MELNPVRPIPCRGSAADRGSDLEAPPQLRTYHFYSFFLEWTLECRQGTNGEDRGFIRLPYNINSYLSISRAASTARDAQLPSYSKIWLFAPPACACLVSH